MLALLFTQEKSMLLLNSGEFCRLESVQSIGLSKKTLHWYFFSDKLLRLCYTIKNTLTLISILNT